ncbi:hypothetical protein Tco_0824421 [Tanacetum coccineum]|uniref:Retrovirus-related Pol polyprotein from transposon TNT 1-94 n=1 Tax=Tanacetum coccineum TaxID=301880 RepID=A0ABQ5AP38_9ASTR
MQTQESKIDTGKALDANLVDTESIRTDSTVQDDSSRSGNDTDADDAYIRPIYDEEPMAEVQLTAECNIFAIGQQHTEQPKIIVEGRVDQTRFSPNKTSAVYEKTSPRSDLRWKPTGRIFKSVGLRWIPTGKLFDSCTSKGTSINVQKEQVEKGIVELFFVGTEYQLADLFTKALSEDRFKYLVRRLGMRCLTPDELEVLAI